MMRTDFHLRGGGRMNLDDPDLMLKSCDVGMHWKEFKMYDP